MRIRPALQPVLVFVVLMAGIGLLLSACSWSVPADPGLNAKLRGRSQAGEAGAADSAAGHARLAPTARAADPGARALYVNHCGRCHEPIDPGAFGAGDWPRYVRRYGPQAGLFGADRTRVLRWLQANAR